MSDPAGSAADSPRSSARAEWLAFRAAREAELREPFGWLALRGFHWLPEQPAELPGVPGRWWADAEGGLVESSTADRLFVGGEPLDGVSRHGVAETGRVPWAAYRGKDGVQVQVELLNRGGRYAVRLRGETSPEREAFAGVPTFGHDPAWVVQGRFVADPDPERRVEVGTCRPDLRQRLRALGHVEVELGGRPQRLLVTTIKAGPSIEFHDPTNGHETPAWRQLKLAEPGPGGAVTLDFNRTIDMWFAFTAYATCPRPAEGNTITVPVRAGERRPDGCDRAD